MAHSPARARPAARRRGGPRDAGHGPSRVALTTTGGRPQSSARSTTDVRNGRGEGAMARRDERADEQRVHADRAAHRGGDHRHHRRHRHPRPAAGPALRQRVGHHRRHPHLHLGRGRVPRRQRRLLRQQPGLPHQPQRLHPDLLVQRAQLHRQPARLAVRQVGLQPGDGERRRAAGRPLPPARRPRSTAAVVFVATPATPGQDGRARLRGRHRRASSAPAARAAPRPTPAARSRPPPGAATRSASRAATGRFYRTLAARHRIVTHRSR